MCHLFSITSAVLGILLSVSALPSEPVSIEPENWIPETGDTFTVDTKNNRGYLVRKDDSQYTSFRVVTGQLRNVSYIGRYYYAKTPDKNWEALSLHHKARSVTFGDGRFLRLYDDNERTAYGIHGHRYAEEMLADEDNERFRSMGCVIVSDEMLDVIQETFHANGDYLQVTTMNEKPVFTIRSTEPEEPDWF